MPRQFWRRVLVIGLTVTSLGGVLFAWRDQGDPEAAKISNPVPATAESIAAGKEAYDGYCAGCHAADAAGGLMLSITEDRGLPPPPSLIDDEWDYGASDGEVFSVTKWGVPPEYIMGGFDGRITDTDIWNVINYLRSLAQKQ
jgi:mono/diheme cytochrome c family protein